jgi:ribosomal protein S18 acetylase RimI-like enzyme
MQLTPATVGDAPVIAAAQVASWRAAFADIFDTAWLAELSVEARAKRPHHIIAAKESHTVVSRHDRHVSGFVSFGKCRDDGAAAKQGEVFALYVDPKLWGRGCGRALLSHAVAQFRADGFTSTSLWVLTANQRGIKFYEVCGFERVLGSEKLFELGGRHVEEIAFTLANMPLAGPSA